MKKLIAATAITVGLGAGAFGVATLNPAGAQDGAQQEQPATDERPAAERHRHRHPVLTGAIRIAAETIGIEPRELLAALRDGKTVAEVAEANGVEPDTVVDALVAKATERIEHFVFETRSR
jgi:hypothetical protein